MTKRKQAAQGEPAVAQLKTYAEHGVSEVATQTLLDTLTAYVQAEGPAVSAARAVQSTFAALVTSIIGMMRAEVVTGKRAALTQAEYDGLRHDWATPLGYPIPGPKGDKGTDTYRAHDARDTFYRQTLGLVRLHPDQKTSEDADTRFRGGTVKRAAVRGGKASKAKSGKANSHTLKVPADVHAALVAAEKRGAPWSAIVKAIEAVPAAAKKA